MLMDPSAEGPRWEQPIPGAAAVPLPTPATIGAPVQSSGSAFIEQNVNYSARPEWVKKRMIYLLHLAGASGEYFYTRWILLNIN